MGLSIYCGTTNFEAEALSVKLNNYISSYNRQDEIIRRGKEIAYRICEAAKNLKPSTSYLLKAAEDEVEKMIELEGIEAIMLKEEPEQIAKKLVAMFPTKSSKYYGLTFEDMLGFSINILKKHFVEIVSNKDLMEKMEARGKILQMLLADWWGYQFMLEAAGDIVVAML